MGEEHVVGEGDQRARPGRQRAMSAGRKFPDGGDAGEGSKDGRIAELKRGGDLRFAI